MPNTALSDARVRTLQPRDSAYDIRDAKLRGFGVRVLPSGAKRFFIHAQHHGERFWKIVGDANTMRVEDARARASSKLAAIRRDDNASKRPDDTLFETVAEMVFERYAHLRPEQSYLTQRRQVGLGVDRRGIDAAGSQKVGDLLEADPASDHSATPTHRCERLPAPRQSHRFA